MNKDNSKVPVAVLCCFIVAFFIQGALKLGGVLIFEKALDWEIFKIIDNNEVLNFIYYSFLMSIAVYCMSLTLTDKPYSKKWYHYLIIVASACFTIAIRNYIEISVPVNMLLDMFIYVLIPLIVNFTTNKQNRLFNNNIFELVLTIAIQIGIYFLYLGLNYWSNILNSLLPLTTVWLSSSINFLIKLEVYFGLAFFMLCMNILIKKIRRNNNMNMPLDIATEEAKIKEIEELEKKGK